MYIDFNKENNKEGPQIKVGDNVKISKSENILRKTMLKNLNMILSVKNCWKILSKKLRKTNWKKFRVEKLIISKSDKLYVKWKG